MGEKMTPKVRAVLERLIAEWDAYIGTDEEDGHDDATLVGDRIREIRRLLARA